MPSNDYVLQCTWCERFIEPSRFPYGMAWLCVCGHWKVLFFINSRIVKFQNGQEKLAIEYIGKIVQRLEAE
jgi:hypothetical protein